MHAETPNEEDKPCDTVPENSKTRHTQARRGKRQNQWPISGYGVEMSQYFWRSRSGKSGVWLRVTDARHHCCNQCG